MTLDQLLMLTTVIDLGNVKAASQKLNKTQPAISRGLKQLETQLDISIIDRTGYRLKLTTEGKQIYSHAKRVLAETDILRQVTQHLSQGHESEIRLTVDGIFDISQLTPTLAQMQKIYPHTNFIIRQEYLSGAFDALLNDEVDIAISPRQGRASKNKTLNYVYLNDHALINVASPSLVARHPNLVSVNQIKAEYLIILQDSGSLTRDFEYGSLDGQKKWYVNDFNTKKTMIINDLGWGKLPKYLIEAELANNQLIAIKPDGNENYILINFYAITHKILGPVASHFWQLLQAQSNDIDNSVMNLAQ
ncbi:MAG: LysR family transcriptional regulator [Rhizobiales bacterium]|nr:LysR family transcriptional regulator [Hyphomicrobiales bacterium]NRB14712.1 LysR family transcriptional regulator [Hyphomicrobiales bacterium]